MRQTVLVNATRALLIVGIIVELLVAASYLLGPHGLEVSVPSPGGWVLGDGMALMHAEGVLAEIPELKIDLTWTNSSEGSVDASTGLPAVELVGPYTANVAFLNPSAVEGFVYVLLGVLGAVLVAVVLWILLRIVSSVRHGSPFTKQNSRRIWILAGVIGMGGTAASAGNGFLDNFLISRSAAAPAFQTSQVSTALWPLLVGLLLAVVAITWNRGVALEEDTEGLV